MKQVEFLKTHMKSGMMALNEGTLPCGSFENVTSVCLSWNCYDNGFLLVGDVEIWSVHSQWALNSSLFATMSSLMELEGFHLKVRNWIYSRRQCILFIKSLEEVRPGFLSTYHHFNSVASMLSRLNNSSYFIGLCEEDSWRGLCKTLSTVSGK